MKLINFQRLIRNELTVNQPAWNDQWKVLEYFEAVWKCSEWQNRSKTSFRTKKIKITWKAKQITLKPLSRFNWKTRVTIRHFVAVDLGKEINSCGLDFNEKQIRFKDQLTPKFKVKFEVKTEAFYRWAYKSLRRSKITLRKISSFKQQNDNDQHAAD